jgi:hypothetical protein
MPVCDLDSTRAAHLRIQYQPRRGDSEGAREGRGDASAGMNTECADTRLRIIIRGEARLARRRRMHGIEAIEPASPTRC